MKYPPTENSARISEIFSSLQGEGTHVGEKHIFVRFEECNIHCEYCDELHKIGVLKTQDKVLEEVLSLEQSDGPHRFVSLTGGEPLLYLTFLKPLMIRLKEHGLRTYLETAGILWSALKEVLPYTDCIAMDMKPSSVTKEGNFDLEHEKFLRLASAKETFVKIVISKELVPAEYMAEIKIIKAINPNIVLILQPISKEIEGHEDPDLMRFLQDLQQKAMDHLSHVRIMPRFHKILNIR